MTDTAPLASIAADLSGGRTSGLRFLDDKGTLAIVLDVTGLAAEIGGRSRTSCARACSNSRA